MKGTSKLDKRMAARKKNLQKKKETDDEYIERLMAAKGPGKQKSRPATRLDFYGNRKKVYPWELR